MSTERFLARYQDGYVLLLKHKHSDFFLSLDNSRVFKFFSLSDIVINGVFYGYYIKLFVDEKVYENRLFLCYKQSDDEEKPTKVYSDSNLFCYESDTGFYIGVKPADACTRKEIF